MPILCHDHYAELPEHERHEHIRCDDIDDCDWCAEGAAQAEEDEAIRRGTY